MKRAVLAARRGSLRGHLRLRPFAHAGQARKNELLIAGASGEGEVVRLGEVNGAPHLNGDVVASEGLVELITVERANTRF